MDGNDPDLPAPAYFAMAIQSVLTGTGQLIKHTSADVVNSLMGTCDVPTLVAEQKKNKAASVSGFIDIATQETEPRNHASYRSEATRAPLDCLYSCE